MAVLQRGPAADDLDLFQEDLDALPELGDDGILAGHDFREINRTSGLDAEFPRRTDFVHERRRPAERLGRDTAFIQAGPPQRPFRYQRHFHAEADCLDGRLIPARTASDDGQFHASWNLRMGLRAAVVSSGRETGVVCGASCRRVGSSAASSAIRRITAMNASMVSFDSVSVGSIIRA